jgi:hypothetical protein
MMAILAIFGPVAAAADVTVYVTSDGGTLTFAAQSVATSLFKKAGVTIEWRGPKPQASGVRADWLWIELGEKTPPDRLPGALAVSYPYAGTSKRITVFTDRIRSMVNRPDQESFLLAYVLVHEITHVIQGVERHSGEGIMKAQWSNLDRANIFTRKLYFAEDDLIMIRNGLARTLTRPSESENGPRPE